MEEFPYSPPAHLSHLLRLAQEPEDFGIEPTEEATGEVVVRWDSPAALNKALVGGKSANNAELLQAGFPVPPGFSVPSYVFEAYVPDKEYLIHLIRSGEYQEAVNEVLSIEPPAEDILAAFDELEVDRVAVRSSAVAEDGSEMSYAGRQETFLYQSRDGGEPFTDKNGRVHEDYGVVEAVKRCWASWVDETAVVYRAQAEGGLEDLRMAVVVQAMIDSEVSGVGFSEDASGGVAGLMLIRANTVQIEAGEGAGAVTDAESDADTYRIEKQSGQVVNIEIFNGGLLRPEHVAQLSNYGIQLEEVFQGPQDFEWGLADNQIYLFQARPITA